MIADRTGRAWRCPADWPPPAKDKISPQVGVAGAGLAVCMEVEYSGVPLRSATIVGSTLAASGWTAVAAWLAVTVWPRPTALAALPLEVRSVVRCPGSRE